VSVQIRPVFGRGNTQALYQGPIEENGVFLDENKVTARVAVNGAFWEYIDATQRAGREVGSAEGGIYSWRLSVQYLDSSGAQALVDGRTSHLTAEAYEFYRASVGSEPQDPVGLAMCQTFKEMVASHGKLMADMHASHAKLVADMTTSLSENMQKAMSAAVAAAMSPLGQAVERVSQMAKEETGRADEMTKVAFKQIKEQQPQPDLFDGIAKILPAGAMAMKAIKDLKN
jgi:hypothetical protein